MSEILPPNVPPSLPPEQTPAPHLWNPNAAATWSLLFSPAFGAFLHARNAETLGRPQETKANMQWFYGYLIFMGVTLLCVTGLGLSAGLFRISGIVILLTWYFSLGKKQIDFVKATYGDAYQRKPWGQPLLIGFGALVAFIIIAVVIGIVSVMIQGTPAA